MSSTHKPVSRFRRLACAAGVALLLAACGGGGGSPAAPSAAPPSWQAAQLAETLGGQAAEAQVAINSDGVAYAVWLQSEDSRQQVFSSRLVNGVWQPARQLPTDLPANQAALTPRVAVLADGRAIAVWTGPILGGRGVFSSTTDATGNWRPKILMPGGGGAGPQDLRLEADGAGNAVAVWKTDSTIHASYFDSTAFGNVEQVSQFVDKGAESPDVTIDRNGPGTALAVWVENDANGQPQVFARSFSDGRWSAAAHPMSDGPSSDPRAAISDNGKAVVTWLEDSATVPGLLDVKTRLAKNVSAGSWETASDTLQTGNIVAPVAAIDAQGRTPVVAWSQNAGVVSDIKSSRHDGTGWKNLDVETAGGDAMSVAVRMDAGGRAFAVWSQASGTTYNMVSSRLDAAATAWGPTELLETDDRGSAFVPSLAVSQRGTAVSAWQQLDGSTDPVGGFPINNIIANVFK